MRYNIYSIYDTAAAIYQRPFVAQSDGEVKRSFGDIAVAADHEIGKHPEDYTLFSIGVFDAETGEIIPLSPSKIATALELVAHAQQHIRNDELDLSPGGTD